jgi:hypothetical protein
MPPTKRHKSISKAEAKRRQYQREAYGVPRVIPFLEWAEMRGLSPSTADRIARAGKIKVTYLSPRRRGVREDHDLEYLNSCLRGGK